MAQWRQVHGFLDGWGLIESIPDNEIVHESVEGGTTDDGKFNIPYRVVSRKVPEREIWQSDASRLLGVHDIFHLTSEELDDVHARLQPLLEAERKQYTSEARPAQFTRLTIPRIRKCFPTSLLP